MAGLLPSDAFHDEKVADRVVCTARHDSLVWLTSFLCNRCSPVRNLDDNVDLSERITFLIGHVACASEELPTECFY